MSPVGKSVPHESAREHVTGRALYIDDLPKQPRELFVHCAGSPVAHGRIRRIDPSAALALPGVAAVFTAADIPGHNVFGPILPDEPFLAKEECCYLGQPLAVVAAENRHIAHKAARLIEIDMEPLPALLSIEDALKAESFLGPQRRICRGNFETAYAGAAHRLEGVFESGGQEQFYFESQVSLCLPEEGGNLRLLSSCQNPTELQQVTAEVMGLSMQQVVCECRRMGGAFGGKETQFALPALMTALVGLKTGRPARAAYTKDGDMEITGKRHAWRTEYQVGHDDEGRIVAARMGYHSDGGAFADLSPAIMERCLLHGENAYFIPNIEMTGQVCRTHFPPNTAFRGFGGPQAVAAMEHILQRIAREQNLDSLEVRKRNLYHPDRGETAPYGQAVTPNPLPDIVRRLEESSDYGNRKKAAAQFNAASTTERKGLALTPVKFGISFTTKFLNQGNALVNLYLDGTAQVSTGGTEMGQGLYTKIGQVAAAELGLSLDAVRVMTTSTEKNPNTSPTAASAGTDLNGMAAQKACRKIRDRLTQFLKTQWGEEAEPCFAEGRAWNRKNPAQTIAMSELAAQARMERIDLGARAFYATPDIGFDRETGQGKPFYYYTCGAAVAEVTVDLFTGMHRVDRVDLLLDLGRRINPAVDRGQVLGGFIQGMGWATTECLVYDETGRLLSNSPTTYKIPGIDDLPRDFRLEFLEDFPEKNNLHGSKAVGEPPLLLGLCVWAALEEAVGQSLPLPATHEHLAGFFS